ncbi:MULTISPECIES: 4-hydroxythreonine-4-phosphate dehydrogenase PdxA [unclassified Oleiphilus]|jgi:4-hydroxythreonine-4-phosphate dehydrogenase|uniref:4-hydroxythreonine-4-phosphate dehydrogenase PdxA n=1 Tax=unclassified Oleiphilus TaxID=2631174 RepID=UPI000A9D75DA|nr:MULTISPECIES: 4-hydroxythreonine-4-phosphate dehydrogenase PdxA [unclassified Oleiphilus]
MAENISNAPPVLALTPGEPAGIGPELVIQLAQSELACSLLIFADKQMMEERAALLNLGFSVKDWQEYSRQNEPGLYIQHVSLARPCQAGQLNVANASYVVECLDQAIDACSSGRADALVTAPLHKGIINDSGTAFTGHTEHLQMRCGVSKVVMMLASPRMKVALATTHLPLAEVSRNIAPDNLKQVIQILIDDLKSKFGIKQPRILVAGLNPHAGENGHMGREEIDIIAPVMASFKSQAELLGPLPADTLFNKKYLEEADAVLAMYHDQGLPVLKFDGFGESVNITLGLPIIRTSVDHGTALDLAGSGQADVGSLKTAVDIALQMASAQG